MSNRISGVIKYLIEMENILGYYSDTLMAADMKVCEY
jgi:hypothetical protein